jgi:thiol-disulfide isomerase/thioredoxin
MKNLLTKILAIVAISSISLVANPAKRPTFDIIDTNNQHIIIHDSDNGLKVEGAEGKVVFVEFFGHKCPPCLKTIPHFINLKNKYKDKLEIIAVEVQGLNHTQLQQFAKQKGINYHVVSDEKAGMFTNYIAQRTQWQGSIPFLLILDKEGNAQVIQVGLIPQNVLENVMDKLLYNKPLKPAK